jgi:hypothetical protein
VESYIVPGQNFGVFLTESVNYLATPELKTIKDAVVTITYNNIVDTLKYSPIFGDLGLYLSSRVAPPDPGIVYFLNVKDGKGRTATAQTTALPKVKPDTVEVRYNAQKKAAVIILMKKPLGAKGYYRFMSSLQKDVVTYAANPEQYISFEYEAFDYMEEAGNGIPYFYEPGDTVNIRFMEINKDYYDFLYTLNIARAGNGSPFQEPSNVITNINGGLGIFTYTNYFEKVIIIK